MKKEDRGSTNTQPRGNKIVLLDVKNRLTRQFMKIHFLIFVSIKLCINVIICCLQNVSHA